MVIDGVGLFTQKVVCLHPPCLYSETTVHHQLLIKLLQNRQDTEIIFFGYGSSLMESGYLLHVTRFVLANLSTSRQGKLEGLLVNSIHGNITLIPACALSVVHSAAVHPSHTKEKGVCFLMVIYCPDTSWIIHF